MNNKATFLITRLLKYSGIILLVYLMTLLIGLIPINNNFSKPDDGIEIHFLSNNVHTDIILPKKSTVFDWSDMFTDSAFIDDVSDKTHIAFGWGEKGFFLDTESWTNFKFSTAAKAMFLPTDSVIHTWFINPEDYSGVVTIKISEQQLKQLTGFIHNSFKTDLNEKVIHIPGYAYNTTDAFFEANGKYHLFNTCNSWLGQALKETGVPVPLLTPMPKTPLLYIQ